MKDDSNDMVRQYWKGKTFTGMQAYAMTKEQFERLKAPTLTIFQPFLNDDTRKSIVEEAVFKLPFSGVGTKVSSIAIGFQIKPIDWWGMVNYFNSSIIIIEKRVLPPRGKTLLMSISTIE